VACCVEFDAHSVKGSAQQRRRFMAHTARVDIPLGMSLWPTRHEFQSLARKPDSPSLSLAIPENDPPKLRVGFVLCRPCWATPALLGTQGQVFLKARRSKHRRRLGVAPAVTIQVWLPTHRPCGAQVTHVELAIDASTRRIITSSTENYLDDFPRDREKNGAACRIRTDDLPLTRRLLYQLS
jgi:hypothetical protein